MEIKFIRDDLEEEKKMNMEVEEGLTVDELLETEGVEREEVLVARNGTIISGRHELQQDDEVKVMDVIAGG